MTRTTVTLEDALLDSLKRRALAENKSLSRFVSELLRKALREARDEGPPEKLAARWRTFSGGRPRVDIADRDALFELMEGEG